MKGTFLSVPAKKSTIAAPLRPEVILSDLVVVLYIFIHAYHYDPLNFDSNHLA